MLHKVGLNVRVRLKLCFRVQMRAFRNHIRLAVSFKEHRFSVSISYYVVYRRHFLMIIMVKRHCSLYAAFFHGRGNCAQL